MENDKENFQFSVFIVFIKRSYNSLTFIYTKALVRSIILYDISATDFHSYVGFHVDDDSFTQLSPSSVPGYDSHYSRSNNILKILHFARKLSFYSVLWGFFFHLFSHFFFLPFLSSIRYYIQYPPRELNLLEISYPNRNNDNFHFENKLKANILFPFLFFSFSPPFDSLLNTINSSFFLSLLVFLPGNIFLGGKF